MSVAMAKESTPLARLLLVAWGSFSAPGAGWVFAPGGATPRSAAGEAPEMTLLRAREGSLHQTYRTLEKLPLEVPFDPQILCLSDFGGALWCRPAFAPFASLFRRFFFTRHLITTKQGRSSGNQLVFCGHPLAWLFRTPRGSTTSSHTWSFAWSTRSLR